MQCISTSTARFKKVGGQDATAVDKKPSKRVRRSEVPVLDTQLQITTKESTPPTSPPILVKPPSPPPLPKPPSPPPPPPVYSSYDSILDIYSPKTVAKVVCYPPQSISTTQDWIRSRLQGRPSVLLKKQYEHSKVLLLCGPSGCGKRALVHACAREMGVEVEEPPGIDSIQALLKVTKDAICIHRLCQTPKVWLFTGIDGFLSEESQSGTGSAAMKSLLEIWLSPKRTSLPPILLTLHSFPDNTAMRLLRLSAGVPRLYFFPVKASAVQPVLKEIALKERIPLQDVVRVSDSFNGDLRQAVLSLGFKRPSSLTCGRGTEMVKLFISPPPSSPESILRGLSLHLYVRARNDSSVEFVRVENADSPFCVSVMGFTEFDIMKAVRKLQLEHVRFCQFKHQEVASAYEDAVRCAMETNSSISLKSLQNAFIGCHATDVEAFCALAQEHSRGIKTASDPCAYLVDVVKPDLDKFVTSPPSELTVTIAPPDAAFSYSVRRSRPTSFSVSAKDSICETPFEAVNSILDPKLSLGDDELENYFGSFPMVEWLLWKNMFLGVDKLAPFTDGMVDVADAWSSYDLQKWNQDKNCLQVVASIRSERARVEAARPTFGSLDFASPNVQRADNIGVLRAIRNDCVENAMRTRLDLVDRLDLLRAKNKYLQSHPVVKESSYTCTDTTQAHVDAVYNSLGVKSKHIQQVKPLCGPGVQSTVTDELDECMKRCLAYAGNVPPCMREQFDSDIWILTQAGIGVSHLI